MEEIVRKNEDSKVTLITTAIGLPIIMLFGFFCFFSNIWPIRYILSFSKCPEKGKICFFLTFQAVLLYIFYSQVILKSLDKMQFDFLGNFPKTWWFDGWEWTHFIVYFIYSFLCPNDWFFVLIVGFTFEMLELVIGKLTRNDAYWTSNSKFMLAWDDIFANLMGYATGHLVQYLIRLMK